MKFAIFLLSFFEIYYIFSIDGRPVHLLAITNQARCYCCCPCYHNISSSVHFIMCESSIITEITTKTAAGKVFDVNKIHLQRWLITFACCCMQKKNHCGKRKSMNKETSYSVSDRVQHDIDYLIESVEIFPI